MILMPRVSLLFIFGVISLIFLVNYIRRKDMKFENKLIIISVAVVVLIAICLFYDSIIYWTFWLDDEPYRFLFTAPVRKFYDISFLENLFINIGGMLEIVFSISSIFLAVAVISYSLILKIMKSKEKKMVFKVVLIVLLVVVLLATCYIYDGGVYYYFHEGLY